MNNFQKGNIGIIAIIAIVLIALGFFVLGGNNEQEGSMEDVMEQGDVMSNEMIKENDSMMKDEVTMGDSVSAQGSYETYSPEKVALVAEEGDVVLFFHATWCPTCRALNTNIENNVSSIPASLTIFKTDYDTYTELKRKYGVTIQHTLVQVDKDGNLIKKWSGSSSLDDLISKVI